VLFRSELSLSPGQTSDDRAFTLETVNCLGCCAIGPVVVVDKDYYGHTTVRKVSAILKKYPRVDES
jgi:NADH:ubiquinone oxidoreductase subunit E